ncbi:MAG: hypothetical protein K1X51_18630 [Rhodospirillaceae bacterium]|nr:hypothetical protein [Rhodospirillaceae bacterium]
MTRPWLITIVDLITLLLTFFVLLFSMSKVEPQRFSQVVQSYGGAFAPAVEDQGRLPKVTAAAGDDLGYLQAVLKAAFASSPALKDVEFRLTPQYLILTLPVAGFYAPGTGDFAEAAKTPVFDLSGVLSNLKNRIAVIGTAAMAQSGEQAAGEAAWSLAITRAKAMADALAAAGYDQPVTVLGRGAAATDVGAALGRVEIMIMPEQASS